MNLRAQWASDKLAVKLKLYAISFCHHALSDRVTANSDAPTYGNHRCTTRLTSLSTNKWPSIPALALALACDVTQEDDLAALVQQTVQRFGKLSILVSNAGGGGPKPFDMPMADFKRAFDLNVFSLFRLAQLAAPEMHVQPHDWQL